MPQPQLDEDVIVINDSPSEDDSKSDGSVVLTNVVLGSRQATTRSTTLQPGAGPHDVTKVDSDDELQDEGSPPVCLVILQLRPCN